MSGARTSLTGWLARMGFADVPRAERELAPLGITSEDHPLLAALAQAADPDLALAGLARIAERDNSLVAELNRDAAFRGRLVAVLGVSKELANHLHRHPEDAALLRGQDAARRPDAKAIREELLRAVGADPDEPEPRAGQVPGRTPPEAQSLKAQSLKAQSLNAQSLNAQSLKARAATGPAGDPAARLAAAYRGRILHLAARDMSGDATVDEVAEELADIADAVLEAALAIARAQLPDDTVPARLAIVAVGKCGARELNYASDIDVIFVAEPQPGHPHTAPDKVQGDGEEAALKTATRLASGVIQVCERTTPEGSIFPVDPNLRPEGRQGTLVRTLASHLAYYDRWAKTWEFQALLKARPAAGDLALGRQYKDAVAPLVWEASRRENFVEDVQAMRRRVVATLPKNMAGRELKLGPGGLRDIEFAVQLLQLVHGRDDDRLRVPATLPAIKALAEGGYIGRADADELAAAYRFLRQTEHLLQVYALRRTHTLPTDPAVLRRLGRALGAGIRRAGTSSGAAPEPFIRNDRMVPPEEAFTETWSVHAQRVRRLHEKLFYRPLLEAVARLPSGAARLTPEAARARLEALGYRDPAGALRHIEALTTGLRRRAAIQRTLLPVLLGWFADAAEPDAGLLAFRQVSEALGDTPWFLRLLRDETKAAERIAYVLASSRYATGLLLRAPEAVAMFADDAELFPRTADALRAEMMAAARRHVAALGAQGPVADAELAAAAVRSLRRRELVRVAAGNVLGLISLTETGEALTAITTAALDAVLAVAISKVEMELRGPLPTRFAVIAIGRYGGHESGFGSDADVIFVHDPLTGSKAGDGTVPAGAVPDGAVPAGAVPDGAVRDGAVPAGAVPAGAVPAGAVPDGAVPAGAVPDGAVPDGEGDGDRRASEAALAVGAELRRLLQIPTPDPPLLVDADLRPEGKQGPLVRSLGACRLYYEQRARPWEYQALLRAEFAAGDAGLGAQFVALADRYRYPAGGLGEQAVREIRRIKARVEAERVPRGVDRALHLKLGPGGLSDVEWTVQLLQLQHGHEVAGLRTTRTLAALDAAVDAGLVTAADAAALSAAWQFAARIRNAIMLVRGRPGDTIPARHDEATAVARLLGYRPNGFHHPAGAPGAPGAPGAAGAAWAQAGAAGAPGAARTPAGPAANAGSSWADSPAAALEEDYRRTARRARAVMDRVFYG